MGASLRREAGSGSVLQPWRLGWVFFCCQFLSLVPSVLLGRSWVGEAGTGRVGQQWPGSHTNQGKLKEVWGNHSREQGAQSPCGGARVGLVVPKDTPDAP